MRGIFHKLFPHWVAPVRVPTRQDELDIQILHQFVVMVDAQVTELEARSKARRHEMLYNDLRELRAKMIEEVDANHVHQLPVLQGYKYG